NLEESNRPRRKNEMVCIRIRAISVKRTVGMPACAGTGFNKKRTIPISATEDGHRPLRRTCLALIFHLPDLRPASSQIHAEIAKDFLRSRARSEALRAQ